MCSASLQKVDSQEAIAAILRCIKLVICKELISKAQSAHFSSKKGKTQAIRKFFPLGSCKIGAHIWIPRCKSYGLI